MKARHAARAARAKIEPFAAVLLFAGAFAQANIIQNGSFEEPLLPPDACSDDPPAPCVGTYADYSAGTRFGGWDVVGSGTLSVVDQGFSQLGFTFPAQDGAQWVDLSGFGALDPVGVAQTVTTQIGEVYDLTFWVGNIVGSPFGVTSTVDLVVDGASLGSFTNSDGDSTTNWRQFSVSFRAGNTSTTLGFFNGDSLSVSDNMNGLDNVVLEARGVPPELPEPGSSALLLTAGGLSVVVLRTGRRRRSGP